MKEPKKIIIFVGACILLGYSAFISLNSKSGFPDDLDEETFMPYLADKPIGEDGYYMLTVAWNIAKGEGITIRPGMVTTGVQPLSTFIYAGVAYFVQFCGGSKWDFARSVILLGGIQLFIFGLIMGKIGASLCRLKNSNLLYFALPYVIVISSFYLFRVFTYGLETGTYLMVFSSLILWMILNEKSRNKRSAQSNIIFGLLCGLAGLTRIDFGIVLAVFLVFSIGTKLLRIRDAFFVGSTALIVVSPWLLWVYSQTGNPIPSSGGAQSALLNSTNILSRFRAMGAGIAQNSFPEAYFGNFQFIKVLTIPFAVALFAIAWRELKSQNSEIRRIFIGWFSGVVVLTFTYITFFWAAHFYARYTAPLVIFSILAVMLTASRLNTRFWKKRIIFPLICISSFFFLINSFFSWYSLHTGRVGNTHSVTAGFIRDNIDRQNLVGSFQSGVVGYYNDNVVNLDGKVNHEALELRNQIVAYSESNDIHFILDWTGYLEGSFLEDGRPVDGWVTCNREVANRATICLENVRK